MSVTASLDHLDSKHSIFKRTSACGFMAEICFEPVSKLPVVAYGACERGEEKEGNIRPHKKHVGSCQHRRGRETAN